MDDLARNMKLMHDNQLKESASTNEQLKQIIKTLLDSDSKEGYKEKSIEKFKEESIEKFKEKPKEESKEESIEEYIDDYSSCEESVPIEMLGWDRYAEAWDLNVDSNSTIDTFLNLNINVPFFTSLSDGMDTMCIYKWNLLKELQTNLDPGFYKHVLFFNRKLFHLYNNFVYDLAPCTEVNTSNFLVQNNKISLFIDDIFLVYMIHLHSILFNC